MRGLWEARGPSMAAQWSVHWGPFPRALCAVIEQSQLQGDVCCKSGGLLFLLQDSKPLCKSSISEWHCEECHLPTEAEKRCISRAFLLTTAQEASLSRALSKAEAKEFMGNSKKAPQHFPAQLSCCGIGFGIGRGREGRKSLLGNKDLYN